MTIFEAAGAVFLGLLTAVAALWAGGILTIQTKVGRSCAFCREFKDEHAPDCPLKNRGGPGPRAPQDR